MKSPSAMEPEFTPEDWGIVEGIESAVEAHFEGHPRSTCANFIPSSAEGAERRHWSEAIRRIRAAGWIVKPNNAGSNVIVERPPLGEVATTARFTRERPATNLAMLVDMIGRTPVEAILDAYLDDRAVEALVTMHRLGVQFSAKLRLLTGRSGAKNLSKSFVADAFIELVCQQGEVKIVGASVHEGRLLLLGGQGVLALGCSLNSFKANERPHRGGDHGEWADFEKRWATAAPF
jgi:hypothetical protein